MVCSMTQLVSERRPRLAGAAPLCPGAMGGEKGPRAEPSCSLAHTWCPQALGVQLCGVRDMVWPGGSLRTEEPLFPQVKQCSWRALRFRGH